MRSAAAANALQFFSEIFLFVWQIEEVINFLIFEVLICCLAQVDQLQVENHQDEYKPESLTYLKTRRLLTQKQYMNRITAANPGPSKMR
jgi:hypothetical protein